MSETTSDPGPKTTSAKLEKLEAKPKGKPEAEAKPEPTLAQLFSTIVAELQAGNPRPIQAGNPALNNKLSPRAAAMLCGHLIFEKGMETAACMTRAEARSWADAFYKSYPAAWGAIVKQDVQGFVRVLRAFSIECADLKTYQSTAENLLKA